MTRVWGDTGLGMMGSHHVLTITYPSPDETLLEPPEALPTSEPGTRQVEFTITAAMLPDIPGATAGWTALIYSGGQNLSGGSRTVYARPYTNGTGGTVTSSNISNNYYFTNNMYRFMDVAAGDTLGVALWASDTGVNWFYKAIYIFATRLTFSGFVLYPKYTLAQLPVLTLGNPTTAGTTPQGLNIWDARDVIIYSGLKTAGVNDLDHFLAGATYGLFQVGEGDSILTSRTRSSATNMPVYHTNYVPTSVAYYGLKHFGF